MRLILSKFARIRPRIVTVLVFLVAAAIIVLANLSFDITVGYGKARIHSRSYGWPVVWHRLVLVNSILPGGEQAIDWYPSIPRLLANLALWVVMLAALTGACEWLVRRYRPRPRWSLRALLVFVGLVAAGCGWYTKARNRAALQDPLIGLRGGYGVPLVFVERWGPKWLDLLGADRLRRRIVLASGWQLRATEPDDQRRFLRLSRLSDVRHISGFMVEELTPATAKALGDMTQLETLGITLRRFTPEFAAALSELRQLRSLSIEGSSWWGEPAGDRDARLSDECLAAIGNMSRLEKLALWDVPLRGKSLACLAGLNDLKSLSVTFWNGEWNGSSLEKPIPEDCLRAIGMLSGLESLYLGKMRIKNESLTCLAGLTRLKTLRLDTVATDHRPMFSRLPLLPRLEALSLSQSNFADDDLRQLALQPRLRAISLAPPIKGTLVTPAGIAALASPGLLEEVELDCHLKSPDMLKALLPLKRLRRLHLGGSSGGAGSWGTLTLDDEDSAGVLEVDEFRRVLTELRRLKPDLIVGQYSLPVLKEEVRGGGMPDTNADAMPDRPSSWLPGGDTNWMTPKERAAFNAKGGQASFYGAACLDREGKLLTVVFDAPSGKK